MRGPRVRASQADRSQSRIFVVSCWSATEACQEVLAELGEAWKGIDLDDA
jgi:hypothetical protein